MKNSLKRKSTLLLGVFLLISVLCAGILTACDKTDENKIHITLNYNDGSGRTEVVELSANQSLPTPTLDGFTFDGWTVDEQGLTPVAELTDSMTVYAQWTKLQYTVSFYVGNNLVKTCSVAHGESAYAPQLQNIQEYIPSDYVFDGWDKSFDSVTNPLTVNAILRLSNARARFMSEIGGDRYVVSTSKGLIGRPVYTPVDNPERRGFTFIGWYKADGTAYGDTDVYEAETVYYAHWSPNAPTMPTVSGLKTFTYGTALNLTSGDARSYLGITYDYAWLQHGNVISNGKILNINRIDAGEYTFTLRIVAHTSINGYEDSANSFFEVPVRVNKAKLVATVAPVSTYFADTAESWSYTASYEGFKFDDDESAISSVSLLNTDYTRFSLPNREYYFTLKFESQNYDVVDENGLTPSSTVTVLKRTLRIRDDVLSKVYDGNVLTKSYSELNMYGTAYADIKATVSIATTSANIGEYTLGDGLIVTEMIVYGPENQIITQGFNLDLDVLTKITPATLSYIKPAPVAYDGDRHGANIAPIANATVSYSLNGEDYTQEAPSFVNAGVYSVYVNIQKENYKTVSEKYDFVINKANVSIVFDNLSITFGADIPQYTCRITGIDKNLIAVNPVCSYTPSDEAGEYVITCDMQNTDNISFSVTNGILTVLAEGESIKPTIVISFGNFYITYGDEMPDYDTYTITDIIGNINADDIHGHWIIASDYTSNPHAGVFDINVSPSGADVGKYNVISYDKLIVNKATLNLSVDEHAPVVFGSPVPTDFTFSAEGFKYDDKISLLNGITVSTTYSQRASASQQYDAFINLNGLSLENYDIVTTPSKLTVNKAQPQIQLPFDGNLLLNYTGDVYDFKAELNPHTTNTDENALVILDMAYGKSGGIYRITLTSAETENYLQATASATVCILSAKIGNALYTLEDALKIGGNIMLIGDTSLSENAQIKTGTTLTIPCREDGTLYAYASAEYGTVNRYINPLTESLLYKLTLRNGATLTVNGTLEIGGEIGQHGGAYQGHTTGMHSLVDCLENSSIIVNDGGIIDCIGGFILGDGGTLTVNSGGTLKHNFTVLYFRGGTSTVGSFQQGGIAPFNVFDMPNVQMEQRINHGATVIAYCDLYASGNHNTAEVTVVDTDNALFNIADKNGYLIVYHNRAFGTAAPQLSVSTYGDVRIGSLKLTISFIIEVTVDMAEVICPLSYIIGLHIYGNLTVANRFKLLPGASVTVEHGGELTLLEGGGLISYTGDWQDTTFTTSDGKPIIGSLPGSETWYPRDKGDARFTVGGTLVVESGAFVAGNVYAQDGAVIRLSDGATINATSIEGFAAVGANGSGQVWYKTAEITKSATGINADSSTVTLLPNNNYKYMDGKYLRLNNF